MTKNQFLTKCNATCWCYYCKKSIPKEEDFIEIYKSAKQGVARINICISCLKKASKEIKPSQLKKRILKHTQEKI